jgi:hypothetical protein
MNQDGRPKTSRRVRNPSPEEYASYVVPSPVKNNIGQQDSNITNSNDDLIYYDNVEDDEMSTEQKLRDQKVLALGCWLFGTMLAV